MPVNGVSDSTNNPYNVNEINSTTPIDKTAPRTENSSLNRSSTMETNNNRVSPTNPNVENSANISRNTVNNGNIGNTVDLIA